MFTCQKTYSDIPFAHRQHKHEGHCRQIHGHNWSFTFTFGCQRLDECGFVVDFGKLKPLRDWISENLDHACVFNRDDPMLEQFTSLNDQVGRIVFKPYIVEQCSSEGLAMHLYDVVDPMIRELTVDRAYLLSVTVIEDSRNSATFAPKGIQERI